MKRFSKIAVFLSGILLSGGGTDAAQHRYAHDGSQQGRLHLRFLSVDAAWIGGLSLRLCVVQADGTRRILPVCPALSMSACA